MSSTRGKKKISCIIPVYNGEDFLAEAIDSVLSQAWPNMEIIVINDGSSDNSAQIAAKFSDVTVYSQPRSGVAAARNAGLALATGDFIAFLDADDIWLAGKLDAQVDSLVQAPSAGYTITLVQHIPLTRNLIPDMSSSTAVESSNDKRVKRLFKGENGKNVEVLLPDSTPLPGHLMSCLLARREVFDDVGQISTATQTRADQEWFLRAREKGIKEVLIPQTLVHRRIHGRNHSLSSENSVVDDFLRIARSTIERRRKEGTLQPTDIWNPQ